MSEDLSNVKLTCENTNVKLSQETEKVGKLLAVKKDSDDLSVEREKR